MGGRARDKWDLYHDVALRIPVEGWQGAEGVMNGEYLGHSGRSGTRPPHGLRPSPYTP